MLRNLGLAGASVTMPLKQQMLPLMDVLDQDAQQAGALNTIVVAGGRLFGSLTDGHGALAALRRVVGSGWSRPDRALILGAGGFAAATAMALARLGTRVQVLSRSVRRSRELAKRAGGHALEQADCRNADFDLLVNATPLGSANPSETPWSFPKCLRGKIVLDAVMAPHETRLISDARRYGGVPVPGKVLWTEQGRIQLQRWFGIEVAAEELEDGA